LFFSHPDDTDVVRTARKIEVKEIKKWVHEKKIYMSPMTGMVFETKLGY